MNILFIYNASAGLGGQAGKLLEIIEQLSLSGHIVTACPVVPAKDLPARSYITRDMRSDLVIVCGGDGTLNHVVDAIIECDLSVPISFFPMGSTNDFAASIYGDRVLTPSRLCGMIEKGRLTAYDIGRWNSRHFNYVAAFGAFTRVSYTTSQQMKNVIGHGAYILNLLASIPESLSTRSHVVIEHDGVTEENDFLVGIVSNTTSVGGVQASYFTDSKLSDGLFELVLVLAPHTITDLGEIAGRLVAGDVDNNYVRVYKFRHASFHFSEETAWTLDGEDGGKVRDAEIDVLPRRMRIYTD